MIIPGIVAQRLYAGGGAEVEKVAHAVRFSGSNYLTKHYPNWTSWNGATGSGKTGTVSFWIRYVGTASAYIYSTYDTSQHSYIYNVFPNAIIFQYDDCAKGIATYFKTSISLSSGVWHHVLHSWDCANATGKIYIDDVDRTVQTTANDVSVCWGTGAGALKSKLGAKATNGSLRLAADLSEFFLHDEYIDLSVETNRRKFLSSNSKPIELGSDGSTPFGTIPVIYMSGEAATWQAKTNLGDGGDWNSVNGLFLDSTNEPVELP